MDPKDFDRLARSAAGGLSRRRVMAWIGAGGAASILGAPSVALAKTGVSCKLTITGNVRIGPSAGTLLTTKSKTPGELKGDLIFTTDDKGAIDKGQFVMADGKKLAVVGQVVGRSFNVRITLADKRVVVLLGTAAEDLDICHGAVDGLLTGPDPGDIGDWHSTAVAGKKTTTSGNTVVVPTATAGQGTGNGGGTTCRAGQIDCGKGCIDVQSDAANCGGCGVTCDANQVCTDGACVDGAAPCDADQIDCGNGCIDPLTDLNNCGDCGIVCEDPLICHNGGCCLADEICDDICVDLLSDLTNCGACGNTCTDTETCDLGTCTALCQDTEVMCVDGCRSLGTETDCTDCDDICAGNELCCLGQGCTDIESDVNNCGNCDVTCDVNQTCTDGTCQ